jgi:hypothetical protein
MAAQTLNFRPEDFPVLLSGCMADLAVQDPCNMLPMGEGMVVNPDLGIFKSLVTLVALRMGDLDGLRQGYLSLGMTGNTGRSLPLMTLKACLFGRAEGGWVVWVMINIVVAGGAGVFELLNMKAVWDPDTVRVNSRRG